MKGDLHCHTKLSDGSEGIEDVIAMAKRIGLDFVSITDHDTVASISRAKILGERYGIQVVPGVEFSAYDYKRKRNVHILCYLPEKKDRLEGICIKICEMRKKMGKELLAKTMQYFPINAEDVMKFASGSPAIFKQHIMNALMCHGYTTRIFGGLYKELFDPKTGRFYMQIPYPDVYQIIDLIRQAQGIVVFAHPYVYDSIELIHELAQQKLLDGVEVFHSRCKGEQEKELIDFAQNYNLVMTGGSDFHGFYSSMPSPVGNRFTPQESLDELFRLKRKMTSK